MVPENLLIQVSLLEPESEDLEQLRIKQLESRGEKNPELDDALPSEPREYEVPVLQDRTCQLCKIDKPVWNAAEQIFYQEDDFYIVDTSGAEGDGKKGHDVRNMAVLDEHGLMSPESGEMVDRLVDITSSHIEEGYMVVYGSMQTFKEHQHIVASDIHGEDMKNINNYMLYEVEGGEAELVDHGTHDTIGEYIHQAAGLEN